ncbi:MAG TPA: hypothetical protein DIW64_02255 [Cellvibrio sp.]|nr:hypothetical protein [Cellvibrio sp.]
MKSKGISFLSLVAYAIFITLVLNLNTYAEGQSPISPDQAWFKPELIENKSPLCQQMLSNTRNAFFENELYSLYRSNNDEVLIAGAYGSSNVDRVLIDNKPVYIRIAIRHGCGGACEGEQAITSMSPIDKNMRYVRDFREYQLQLMPAATEINNTLFIKGKDGNHYLISIHDSIEVNQLQADATWRKACEISISPTDAQYADVTNAAQLRDVAKKLEFSLLPIIGTYGNCGSSNAGGRRLQLLKQLLAVASYRPWVLNQTESEIKNSFAYLNKWSLQGVHQFKSYTKFNEKIKEAIPSIKDLYVNLYGLDNEHSEQMANSVINSIVASVISVEYPPQPEDRKKVLKVLLEKGDLSVIKSIATNIKLLDEVNSDEFAYDSLLATSVTYPEALQYLLEQGLDPNQPNAFGKTPLMYAVQNNQLESVSILLNKKADPNLSTIIPEDSCNYTLSKSGMRALHYAVRYASPELIKLLIKNGADPIVTTSEKTGGYPIDWMHK